MTDQRKHPGNAADSAEIVLDDSAADIEEAMRDALSAVEAVEADAAAGEAEDPAAAVSRADAPAGPGAADTAQPGTAAGAPGGAEASEIETLRREIADLRDRSLRTLADFDNFRKRAERERQDVRRYALLEPLRDFLPIADNLDRALTAGGSAEDLKHGVELILRQMQDLLRRFGVREVPADGEAFNPMMHEAVARTESDQVTVPVVAETLERGYMLHDRLLRPAMVRVAVPAESVNARTSASVESAGARPSPDGGREEPPA